MPVLAAALPAGGRLVVADHAQEAGLRAQRADVVGHVGGGADALFLARDRTTGTGASGEMRSTAPCQ
jgi:hypothetical protein